MGGNIRDIALPVAIGNEIRVAEARRPRRARRPLEQGVELRIAGHWRGSVELGSAGGAGLEVDVPPPPHAARPSATTAAKSMPQRVDMVLRAWTNFGRRCLRRMLRLNDWQGSRLPNKCSISDAPR